MSRRVSSARFVGRSDELSELAGALERAAAGDPVALFVAGESGVGKTRLLAELDAHARESAHVLVGECVELGEGELPYAPLSGALRPLGAARVRELIGDSAAALSPLLPELGAAEPPAGELGQARIFEALLALISRLADEKPVVLAIEDLHWADRSSRDFLSFLVRNVRSARLLLVCTYRSDELHRRHPLRPLLAELERSPRSLRISLPRFTADEMREQLADILGEDPDPETVSRMHERTEGNPLFAEELLAADACNVEQPLPDSLQEALLVRVEALGPAAHAALRIAAVAGRRTQHELLAAAAEQPEDELVAGLRDAVAGHVLTADAGDGSYSFRHALLREAVYADLLPGERTRLHVRVAEALERLGGSEAELANHWYAAHELRCALRASLAAGRAAKDVYAYGEALDHLMRALEIWDRVPDAEEHAGMDHAEVLRLAALAADVLGEHLRAAQLLDQALAEIEPAGDTMRTARLHERRGRYLWEGARWTDAMAAYHQALDLLPPGESAERALALAGQARVLSLSGHFSRATESARAAIAAAEAAGAFRALSSALNTLGMCLVWMGQIDEGIASLRRSLELALASDVGEDASRAYNNLAECLDITGRTEEALALLREGRERVVAYGRPVRWLEIAEAAIRLRLGDLEAAERLLDSCDRSATGTTDLYAEQTLAALAYRRGRKDEARRRILAQRERSAATAEPQWNTPLYESLSLLALEEGRLEEARALVDRGLALLEPAEDDARTAVLASTGVAVEAAIAARARDLGDETALAAAREHGEAHLELARESSARVDERLLDSRAPALEAEAHFSVLSGRPDPAAWAAAAAVREQSRQPWHAAFDLIREAEAHMALDEDRQAAARVLSRACEIGREMGSPPILDAAESLARRARISLGSPADAGDAAAPAQPVAEEPEEIARLGLTPREREVLELLTEGRTNREIAETLYMSEKTASVHVSRILAKLGVRSRTQAAAVAHRLGISAAVSS